MEMPAQGPPSLGAVGALARHWPEYGMEAAALGLFMVSACLFGILLEHPESPVRQAISSDFLRRVLMGLAMGSTAVAIIYSPWGKQSGAHMNPAVSLTFLRLGKIPGWDALFYIAAQFVGGVLGVLLVSLPLMQVLAHPKVNYVATVPGESVAAAFAAEILITFILMSVVLYASNHERFSRFTGLFAGTLVASYITFEAPISGMSMNPARTFGSAFSARVFDGLWIYFTAPVAGMLLAAELYLWRRGRGAVGCCKLQHNTIRRCIFCGANGGFTA